MPARRIARRAVSGEPADLLARLCAARGVEPSSLDQPLAALEPPASLRGLPEAAIRLADAVENREEILVVGDYDADGATSTALLLLGLGAMGCATADFLVPNRFTQGYGLTPELLAVARQRVPAPQLLVTVDNGISSIAGIVEAKALGIDVIVTDHHLPGPELPPALAIVNPNQPGCGFPAKSLAGVGVVFYLLGALRAELRRRDWFERRGIAAPRLADYLDLVALGTVADLAPLDANNRILVQQGLLRLRAGGGQPGVRALLEAGDRDPRRAVSADFGFAAGPRLNAAGRLEDMSLGIRCLLERDPVQAFGMARRLDDLNRERRGIEADMQRDALALVAGLAPGEEMPWGLCLYRPEWHQGVVGLVASRLKERLTRPVIAFAPGGDGELKGSARSVRGFHVRDALATLHARSPGLILRFGGHAMAAGLTLAEDRFSEFARAFDAEVRRVLDPALLEGVLETDGELDAAELTLQTAEWLREVAPWGQQFPEPLFDGEFLLREQRLVGERHLRLSLSPVGAPQLRLPAIVFGIDTAVWPDTRVPKARLVYRLDVNDYRGTRSLQLVGEHIEALPTP